MEIEAMTMAIAMRFLLKHKQMVRKNDTKYFY